MSPLRRHKWLILRRASQAFFLALFLTGPLLGLWIAKGTLAESLTFGVLPLLDPFIALQSLAARHIPATQALIGAVIVLAGYGVLRGRLYCSWVCPINVVTDLAAWTRRRLGLKEGMNLGRRTRFAVLGGVLLASAATGAIAWEVVNPITIVHRALVFASAASLTTVAVVVAALFLFDTFVSLRGWCGHLCPVGAFYGLLGRAGGRAGSMVRVATPNRAACDDCRLCYAVCPEPHVINPALKGEGHPVIVAADCTACARCVDVCPRDVFAIGIRHPFRKETRS